ncbi:hypothetical protein DRH13_05915 [Candidatus Woesebacteria bacterium]|nr:MAG: hypothetical protein DRH13_05915 [Candidatus Woesebacteria bacterium]
MAKKKSKARPKCQCGIVWLWDWKFDCFVKLNGKPFKEQEFNPDLNGGLGFSATTYTCDCGRINGINIFHNSIGGTPVHPKDHQFSEVDWMEDRNSYEEEHWDMDD